MGGIFRCHEKIEYAMYVCMFKEGLRKPIKTDPRISEDNLRRADQATRWAHFGLSYRQHLLCGIVSLLIPFEPLRPQ